MSEREPDSAAKDAVATLVLSVPAEARYTALPRMALTAVADAWSIAARDLGDLQLALTEAVTNAIVHAYPRGTTGRISIRMGLEPRCVWILVEDEGVGIDLGARAVPTDSAADRALLETVRRRAAQAPDGNGHRGGDGNGRLGIGVAIMRALVDELSIAPRDGPGTRVRLVKRLQPASGGP